MYMGSLNQLCTTSRKLNVRTKKSMAALKTGDRFYFLNRFGEPVSGLCNVDSIEGDVVSYSFALKRRVTGWVNYKTFTGDLLITELRTDRSGLSQIVGIE